MAGDPFADIDPSVFADSAISATKQPTAAEATPLTAKQRYALGLAQNQGFKRQLEIARTFNKAIQEGRNNIGQPQLLQPGTTGFPEAAIPRDDTAYNAGTFTRDMAQGAGILPGAVVAPFNPPVGAGLMGLGAVGADTAVDVLQNRLGGGWPNPGENLIAKTTLGALSSLGGSIAEGAYSGLKGILGSGPVRKTLGWLASGGGEINPSASKMLEYMPGELGDKPTVGKLFGFGAKEKAQVVQENTKKLETAVGQMGGFQAPPALSESPKPLSAQLGFSAKAVEASDPMGAALREQFVGYGRNKGPAFQKWDASYVADMARYTQDVGPKPQPLPASSTFLKEQARLEVTDPEFNGDSTLKNSFKMFIALNQKGNAMTFSDIAKYHSEVGASMRYDAATGMSKDPVKAQWFKALTDDMETMLGQAGTGARAEFKMTMHAYAQRSEIAAITGKIGRTTDMRAPLSYADLNPRVDANGQVFSPVDAAQEVLKQSPGMLRVWNARVVRQLGASIARDGKPAPGMDLETFVNNANNVDPATWNKLFMSNGDKQSQMQIQRIMTAAADQGFLTGTPPKTEANPITRFLMDSSKGTAKILTGWMFNNPAGLNYLANGLELPANGTKAILRWAGGLPASEVRDALISNIMDDFSKQEAKSSISKRR